MAAPTPRTAHVRIKSIPSATAVISNKGEMTYQQLWEHVRGIGRVLSERGSIWPGYYDPFVASNHQTDFWFLLGRPLFGAVPCPLGNRWSTLWIEAAKLRFRAINDRRKPIDAPTLPQDHPTIELPSSQQIVVVHTSGSSSGPKPAVLSAGNVIAAAKLSNRCLRLGLGDKWLLSLPLHHVGGLAIIYRCMLSSAAMILPHDEESLSDLLIRYAPTHVSLVATQLYRLLRDEKSADALAKCKAVVMGGGPTPEGLVREARERGISLAMTYGMTETAAMICSTQPFDSLERLLSSGKPLTESTVSISAEGEILVRGDQLFLGYLQPDGSLLRPLTEDGWFQTGDLGHFDDAGYLHVTGRRDNMFISGGENIQPEEIEQALRNIDGVEEAIVAPVENAEWGKRPVAFVRLDDGRALDPAALEKRLRETLPGYKIPRTIHPWPTDLAQPGLKPARRDFEKRARELATD